MRILNDQQLQLERAFLHLKSNRIGLSSRSVLQLAIDGTLEIISVFFICNVLCVQIAQPLVLSCLIMGEQ